MKTDTYPAAVLLLTLAAAMLIPLVFGPVGVAHAGMGSVGPASDRASSGAHPAGDVVANSNPRVVWNATNLIADGTFDAIPGPWNYTNGTTGAVTASRDPTARARLGYTEPVLRFDGRHLRHDSVDERRLQPAVRQQPVPGNRDPEGRERVPA